MTHAIRPARETDAASIVELLNPIIEDGRFTIIDRPIAVEEQIAFIRDFPGRGTFLVAVDADDRTVRGLQDVQPLSIETPALDHVGVISTFIRLDAHRQGIGRGLARATFDAAARQGFEKLVATVRADNPVAVAFYESLGFRPVGTAARHARLRGRLIDEIILEGFIHPD